jgi:uncharacterized protein (TIGR04255 family)
MCNVRELIDDLIVDRPRLQNAPLTAVLCQVQYPRQLALGAEEVRPVQKALAARYPLVSEERAVELTVEAGPSPKGFFAPAGAEQTIFRFRDTAEDWTVTIGPEALSLETSAYVGMRDMLERWLEVAEAASDSLTLTTKTRLGLRYINEIEAPGFSRDALEGWAREELVSIIGSHEARTGDLQRFLSQAVFRQPDGSLCNLRHGLAPNAQDPEQAVFLLDLDFFVEETSDFDLEDQVRSLVKFNEGARDLFCWAFSEKAYESFGPELDTTEGEGAT